MKGRGDKSKEYYMDSKQITAKKGKKNHDTYTPNSLSTSHNHHKYQKYDETLQEQTNKQTISFKQFQAVLRSLYSYCTQPNQLMVRSRQKQLTARVYHYLCQKYRVIGDQQQILKYKMSIEEHLPRQTRTCQRCLGNGSKCNQAHINYINQVLGEDIQVLQRKLQQLKHQNQFFTTIIQSKNNNEKETVERLHQIIQQQEKMIRELQEKNYASVRHDKKARLQIFIEQDD